MNDIKIMITSYHKKMTNNHLAQANFVAILPKQLWDMYIEKTNINKQSLGRIRFMEYLDTIAATFADADGHTNEEIRVFGRVSHGYGYDIAQDIYNSIMYSKGAK